MVIPCSSTDVITGSKWVDHAQNGRWWLFDAILDRHHNARTRMWHGCRCWNIHTLSALHRVVAKSNGFSTAWISNIVDESSSRGWHLHLSTTDTADSDFLRRISIILDALFCVANKCTVSRYDHPPAESPWCNQFENASTNKLDSFTPSFRLSPFSFLDIVVFRWK